jgi:hypothetical protein
LFNTEISKAAISKYLDAGNMNFDQILTSTNIIPAHGFVVMKWPIEYSAGNHLNEMQIVFSTGSFTATSERIDNILRTGTPLQGSEAQYMANLREIDPSVKIVDSTGGLYYASETASEQIPSDYISKDARLVGCGKINVSSDLALQFVKLFTQHDKTPYNVFTHNCQVQCKSIIKFLTDGTKPHWWNSNCSAQMSKAAHSTFSFRQFGSGLPVIMPIGGFQFSGHTINGHDVPGGGVAGYDAHSPVIKGAISTTGTSNEDAHIASTDLPEKGITPFGSIYKNRYGHLTNTPGFF